MHSVFLFQRDRYSIYFKSVRNLMPRSQNQVSESSYIPFADRFHSSFTTRPLRTVCSSMWKSFKNSEQWINPVNFACKPQVSLSTETTTFRLALLWQAPKTSTVRIRSVLSRPAYFDVAEQHLQLHLTVLGMDLENGINNCQNVSQKQ